MIGPFSGSGATKLNPSHTSPYPHNEESALYSPFIVDKGGGKGKRNEGRDEALLGSLGKNAT